MSDLQSTHLANLKKGSVQLKKNAGKRSLDFLKIGPNQQASH